MSTGHARFALDNTAISNFSVIGRMDVLRDRYGGRLVVTPEVLAEAERGPNPASVSQALSEGWIGLRRIYADSPQYTVFVELRERGFGFGEASALAVCSFGETWVFVSDDLDARREAGRRGVEVVGTYGILARHVAEGGMDLAQGNELLRRMIDAGFRSHSSDLREEVVRLRDRP